MNNKKWQFYPQLPDDLLSKLQSADSQLSVIVGQLLYNRDLKTISQMTDFLAAQITGGDFDPVGDWLASHDPFLFKDMDQAVTLIIDTIKQGELIIVYGDYDADGVTAAATLVDTLRILGAKIDVYLPDRVSEGYGLNTVAIDQIKFQGAKLIITVDNGIRNQAEIAYAKSLDLQLIVTDHHVVPEKSEEMPDCLIIDSADPKSGYPFPFLAGVGVAFKLACALLFKANLPAKQKKLILERNLDLVAVGTIADLVPLIGENRLLTKRGLEILNRDRRLGLRELIKIVRNDDRPLQSWNVSWQIAPRLNAASRIGHANSAFTLLTTEDATEAKELSQELNRRNLERQEITDQIISQVESGIDPNNLPNIIISLAESDQFWNEGVIGLVAGKICEKYYRPTLIVSRIVEEAELDPISSTMRATKVSFKGSGRSVDGFNLIAAIEKTADFLDKYGGHPMACGFSLKNEVDWENFYQQMQLIGQEIDPQILVPKLKLDAPLLLADINLELAEQINLLAPFGQANPQPKFACQEAKLMELLFIGSGEKHVKLRFSQTDAKSGQAKSIWTIFFNGAKQCRELNIGQNYDLAYYLEINEFNGRRDPQLKLIDIREHE